MILQAGYDCYLTQEEDVTIEERRFENSVVLRTKEEVENWREVTSKEKDEIIAKSAFMDVKRMDYESLERVSVLMKDISANINMAALTNGQAIEMAVYFPRWEEMVGEKVEAGYRIQCEGKLYEVIQEHTIQETWKPGVGTESIYKLVQIEHEGTREDPVKWEKNMVLEEGKYYEDMGAIYICIRNSEIGMSYDLEDLVTAGYVKLITGDSGNNKVGNKEDPIPYEQGMELEEGKYYIENGIVYRCTKSTGPLYYELKDVTAIAERV